MRDVGGEKINVFKVQSPRRTYITARASKVGSNIDLPPSLKTIHVRTVTEKVIILAQFLYWYSVKSVNG